jgi:hypothetical protein
LVAFLCRFEDVDEGTPDDLDDSFIDLECFFETNLNGFIIMPIDKLIEGL